MPISSGAASGLLALLEKLLPNLPNSIFQSIANNLEVGMAIYNQCIKVAYGILTQDPESFSSSAWSTINTVNSVFVGIASTLVVVFFLIGFCEESMDPRHELRIETIIRGMCKLFIAEFFVSGSLTIVKSFFGLIRYATSGLNISISGVSISESGVANTLPAPLSQAISQNSYANVQLNSLSLLLFSSLFSLIIMATGIIIIYQAFARMIKLLSLIPYGALANSTIAGNHMLKQTSIAFWKYALCTILEALTMIIAITICSTLFASPDALGFQFSISGMSEIEKSTLNWMLERTVIAVTTCGVVKGASTLTQKVFGL
ncbi:MAG: hypothetical protein E7279_01490 [Lachnospiraceae bacterium]|nr:hypothetical protein [Lachnospiraceae bacterium]